jgi:hypothetical protein
MDLKRISIGTLVGLVVLYALGWLFWGMLFADFFTANEGSATGVDREAPILWAMILGTLMYAKLVTLALVSRGENLSLVDGAKAGAVVGLLLWGTADFILFGLSNLNTLTGTIADTLLEAVRGGVAGAIIALVLSKVGSGQSA